MSSAMEDTIRLSGNKWQLGERFGGVASPIQPLESHEVALFHHSLSRRKRNDETSINKSE